MVPAFDARVNWLLNGTLATEPRSMNISSFFNSYAGMYVAQSFCHSIIVAVIADRALKAWRVETPEVRQRFRLIAIIFPIVSFPLYQLINPGRSSALFRLGSLFDINRWLGMEIWGLLPIGLLFLLLLGFTTLVFLFQEMFPVLMHSLESKQVEHEGTHLDEDPFIEEASRLLSIKIPDVVLLDDDEPLLFSSTGKDPVIFTSTGLSRALTKEQMQAALAHEIAHIARSRRPLLIVVFIFRIIMFFNPVVLVKFRRAVKDEEKICDDIAVSLTHNPAALAEALKKFLHKKDEVPEPSIRKLSTSNVSLEEHSHNLHLESRIKRLESGSINTREGWGVPFIITLLVAVVLNYFIV
jgi:beta-lactamase regulating signal transducer with metallopeptidase domain